MIGCAPLILWFPALTLVVPSLARATEPPTVVVCSGNAGFQEKLAAREIRRYIYLRTGELLPILQSEMPPAGADVIAVARKDRPIAESLADAVLKTTLNGLQPQQYVLKTFSHSNRRVVLIAGGDDVGTLYGTYCFVEHLGVRFFMHGDVIPDQQIALKLPQVDETGKPLFGLRGLNPWGWHVFGIDLWDADQYKAHFGQMAKMRMNFLGIHCYPECHPFPEPTVWLGLDGEFDDQGRVNSSYPSKYFNTAWPGTWGAFGGGEMSMNKTSGYLHGGALLFEGDDWGPDVMTDYFPNPTTPAACNDVFNRTGQLFREAFTFARHVGVKTCIGTETPITIPESLQNRLKAQGKDPADPVVVKEVYEGIFRRIAKTHPLDYYWLWTPESWTWNGNTSNQLTATVADMKIALQALEEAGRPFELATAGWVLGPVDDRAAFDRMLPDRIALSAINRTVGHTPVDEGFARVEGREKWAIPWLEDDLALASPQLWVGRIRKDAADALAYGCTGLMGLHWRTRILGPNMLALARAGWDQHTWNPTPGEVPDNAFPEAPLRPGPLGGNVADYPGREISGTDDDQRYQSCRYDLRGYRFRLPEGKYRVTLQFCEPHFTEAGKRVFDVKLQGKTVLEEFDIFAEVGQFAALDYTFGDVEVSDGWLKLDFVYRESLPCISAIVMVGSEISAKINCGGPAYRDFAADGAQVAPTTMGPPRGLAVEDFYADWTRAMFGAEVACETAAIFSRIDGRLPRAGGNACPAGLAPDQRSWEQVAEEYSFVDELAACRDRVRGPGNLERFDYWLGTMQYLRAKGRLQCAWAVFNAMAAQWLAEEDPTRRKQLARQFGLPAYRDCLAAFAEAYACLLDTANTYGGMATVINWEHSPHYRLAVLEKTGQQLAEALGESLPPDARPTTDYFGRPRLFVPTVRTSLVAGESLRLKVIILADRPPKQATLLWRTMGRGDYQRTPLKHVSRAVYTVSIPPDATRSDLEWYVESVTADDQALRYPPTAPTLPQTVVVVPPQ